MSSHDLFIRKIIYLAFIVLLLFPLFGLSKPATRATKGSPGSPGGVLARLRGDYHLNPAELGQIDPTSVTIKLSTLGLRGVAANILWEKANDYQMKKDWANRAATLKQITKIQPNFINVWINQAWNVSYNISVQFRDDYRERYRWVIKGFDFLKDGIAYNQRQPRLQYELGRMISQKIGKADESKQFRRLFKQDDDFNADVPLALRDNWLVGREWYGRAVNMVDTLGVSMMGQSPLIFRSSGPMCLMSYAEALEKDGTFGEVASRAWIEAGDEWRRYGGVALPTSFTRGPSEPIMIRLNDQESEDAEAKKLVQQLESIQPGLREKIVAEKRARLTPAQREALDTLPEKRTGNQFQLAAQAEEAVATTHDEVARRITGPRRKEAIDLAREAAEHEQLARYTRQNRDIVNFTYSRGRAQTEQTNDLLTARKLIFQGDQKYAEGDLVPARDAYREGLRAWRRVLDAHREYITDQTTGEDLLDVIQRYRRILNQLDEKFPEPFILQDVIENYRKQHGEAQPQQPTGAAGKKPAEKAAK